MVAAPTSARRGQCKDAIAERWPRLERPGIVFAISEGDDADAHVRVDPDERAGTSEVTERGRTAGWRHPVRLLPVVQLEPETPVEWIEPPDAGQQPDEAGKSHGCGRGEGRMRDERRTEEFEDECGGVPDRPV